MYSILRMPGPVSYSSKMILDRPNCFGRVQIILHRFKLWTLIQKSLIWTWLKQIGPIQNGWYSTKIIWTVHNYFGPIEGQGINESKCIDFHLLHYQNPYLIKTKDNINIKCMIYAHLKLQTVAKSWQPSKNKEFKYFEALEMYLKCDQWFTFHFGSFQSSFLGLSHQLNEQMRREFDGREIKRAKIPK